MVGEGCIILRLSSIFYKVMRKVEQNTTIAAVATAYGTGAVSIIRISGPLSVEITDKIFLSITADKLSEKQPRTAVFGKIIDNESILDEVVAVYYKAPQSYTGEDVIEISCHGGIVVTEEILRLILRCGAKPASPGEFTKRAFIAGKIDLTEAEAVADIINSQNRAALKAANIQKVGALHRESEDLRFKLLELSSHIVAWIDFPEEDVEQLSTENLKQSLRDIDNRLSKLLMRYDKIKQIKEGVTVAIVGRPNTGKSSLMNLLCAKQRSIVTDIPGTTRDIVEQNIQIGDISIKLLDTAGIRDTNDIVELEGVKLSYEQIEQSDIIICVFDSCDNITQQDREIVDKLLGKQVIAVINKTDLEPLIDEKYIKSNFENVVYMSAVSGDGFEILTDSIEKLAGITDVDFSSGFVANERQYSCVIDAKNAINSALDSIDYGMTLDAIGVDIEQAIEAFSRLSGAEVSEDIINMVFERFCVGK